MKDAPIPVKLDRERHVAWSNSTIYRLSLLTLKPSGTYALIVQIIWAALVPDDCAAFPSPEHLAEFMPLERSGEFLEIVAKLKPKPKNKEAEEKNGSGSTGSPSPASS